MKRRDFRSTRPWVGPRKVSYKTEIKKRLPIIEKILNRTYEISENMDVWETNKESILEIKMLMEKAQRTGEVSSTRYYPKSWQGQIDYIDRKFKEAQTTYINAHRMLQGLAYRITDL